MTGYRILIVDDEPHAIEHLAGILDHLSEEIEPDLYRARSGSEALAILELGRMDLVITDIEMPGLNGLELIRRIRDRWPQCHVMILTAFPNFDYAYAALQMHTDGYILKTESDSSIQSRVLEVLNGIRSELHYPVTAPAVPVPALPEPLSDAFLQANGFSPEEEALCMIVCAPFSASLIADMLVHYITPAVERAVCFRSPPDRLVCVVRRSGDFNQIRGILEIVQKACESTLETRPNLLLMPLGRPVAESSQAILNRFTRMTGARDALPFVYCAPDESCGTDTLGLTDAVIDWLRRYIDNHVAEDVSLVRLSVLTGYNPPYLSSVFHQITGTTLSRYIAEKKMEQIRIMLSDASVPVQEIAQRMGFSSHSYFSRFVRHMTGKTPQQMRTALLLQNNK